MKREGNEKESPMTLKHAREKKGLTQMQLSEISGINCITLSDYERGAKEPILENMIKLEKILGKIDWDNKLSEADKYFLVQGFKELIENYPLRKVAYFLYKQSGKDVIGAIVEVLTHLEEIKNE